MKKLLLICLVAVLSIGVCSDVMATESSKKSIVSVTLATNLHCGSCIAKIMDNVHVLGRGIKDIKTDFPTTKDIVVFYDEKKNSVDAIIEGLAELDIKAVRKADAKKLDDDCTAGCCSSK